MTLKDYIKKTDFISYEVNLLIDGSSRAQSLLGGILSIMIMCITAASVYFFSRDLFFRLNPIVNFNKYYKVEENFTITRKNFLIAMAVRRNNSSDFDDPRSIYEISALRFHYKNVVHPDGKKESILATTPVPLSTCTAEDFADYPDLNMPYEKYTCLAESSQVEMFNPLGFAGDNAYLNVFYRPCQPETAKAGGYECAPQEVIDKELSASQIWARFDNYFVEHSSFLNPIKKYIKNVIQDNNMNIYNRTTVGFGKLQYDTDKGILFEDLEKQEKFSYQDDSYRNYVMAESNKFVKKTFHQLTITFGSSGLHDNYLRTYKKFQNILADIGGFSKGCMIIASLMNYTLSKSYFYSLLFDTSLFAYAGLKSTTGNNIRTSTIQNSMTKFTRVRSSVANVTNDIDEHTEAVKIGSSSLRKIVIGAHSYFLRSVCCMRKAKDKKMVQLVGKFYNHSLDVRTIIKTIQKVNLLKNALLSKQDREIFDRLDFLVDLNYSDIEWKNSSQEMEALLKFITSQKIEAGKLEKFLEGDALAVEEPKRQNYISKQMTSKDE